MFPNLQIFFMAKYTNLPDMNIDLRKKAKIILKKIMENLTKHRDIKLVTT